MKKLLILAALAVMSVVGSSTILRAQINIPPGERIVCTLECHGLIFIRLSDGSVIETVANAEGEATLESVESNDGSDGTPPSSTLQILDITVRGNDPNIGSFEFHFDADLAEASGTPQTKVITTEEAYAAGEQFPAVCDVYARVSGTVEAFPGNFYSTSDCHMRASNLATFNPHDNETYEFVNSVEFVNDEANVSFTIPAGATVVLN